MIFLLPIHSGLFTEHIPARPGRSLALILTSQHMTQGRLPKPTYLPR